MHKQPHLTFWLAGMLLAAPLAAFAQSAPAPVPAANVPTAATDHRHHGGGAMRRSLAELGLSADQKARIKDMMTSYRQSRNTATPETRQALRAQIEGVLTPDQRTRFTAEMQRAASARNDASHRMVPQPAVTP